jgi:hypothetical protein
VVPISSSDASDGICTFSRGRAAPDFEPFVSLREGGANSDVVDCVLAGWGIGIDGVLRGGCLSGDPSFLKLRGAGVSKKCAASTDPPSSIGVKILFDLDDRCLG